MHQKSFAIKSWKSKIIYFFVIPCTAVFVTILLLVNQFFTIKRILIVGLDKNEESVDSEYFMNKNLLLIKQSEIRTLILQKNAIISDVQIQKKFPDTLILTVQSYTPVAILQADNGFFILGDRTNILKKVKKNNTTLPLIRHYQVPQYSIYTPGDKIAYSDLGFSLHLIGALEDTGLHIDSIDINSLSVIVLQQGEKSILFSSDKNEDVQVYQLELILKQFKLEGKDFKKLDLRFDKPVVEFK